MNLPVNLPLVGRPSTNASSTGASELRAWVESSAEWSPSCSSPGIFT